MQDLITEQYEIVLPSRSNYLIHLHNLPGRHPVTICNNRSVSPTPRPGLHSKNGQKRYHNQSRSNFHPFRYVWTSQTRLAEQRACLSMPERESFPQESCSVSEAPEGRLQQCLQPSLQIYCLCNQQNHLARKLNPNPIKLVTIFLPDHENIKASEKRKHHH